MFIGGPVLSKYLIYVLLFLGCVWRCCWIIIHWRHSSWWYISFNGKMPSSRFVSVTLLSRSRSLLCHHYIMFWYNFLFSVKPLLISTSGWYFFFFFFNTTFFMFSFQMMSVIGLKKYWWPKYKNIQNALYDFLTFCFLYTLKFQSRVILK